ncbi:uncharacterized ATP-dependent helicase C29A10.10c-like [Aphidius gifuensis]|uniref:uncharacterized ATP-dependent helicase C29A10.10c-like n=1 Tax=Aphidius gifuensis TaxID=684658 RepID=UPI001CDCB8D7|nr:uncharacterized ATP-dependent helicase C29A10.10c-like [Aphidius gifuensis]
MEDIILKRRNTESDEYITIERGSAYNCGRAKNSHIYCPSPVVSRNHCIFFLDSKTKILSVTDLTSSNGVYVNENRIDPKINFALNISDVIGIGCCDFTSEKDFVYEITTLALLKASKKRKRINTDDEVPAKVIKVIVNDINENNNAKKSKNKTEELSQVSSTTDLLPHLLNSKNDNQEFEENKNKTKEFTNQITKKLTTNKTADPSSKNNDIDASTSIENIVINKKQKTDNDDEDLREIINKKKKQKRDAASTSIDSIDIHFGDISNITPDTSFSSKYETDPLRVSPQKKQNDESYLPSPRNEEMQGTYSQIHFVNLDDKYDDNYQENEEEEEDFFPCSQLFEDPNDFKVKTEKNNHELSDEFSFESEKNMFQENNDVIKLSDDEDDDEDEDVADDSKRWLARIYRSQILNESQIKEEVNEQPDNNLNELINDDVLDDMGEVLNDDIFKDLDDEVDQATTSVIIEDKKKSTSEKEKSKSSEKSAKKIDDKADKHKKDKKKDKRKDKEKSKSSIESKSKKSNERSSSSSVKKSIDLDETKISNQVHLSSVDKNKNLSKKIDTSSSSIKNTSIDRASSSSSSISKLKAVRKIQQIEAPFLLKGGRQSVSLSVTTYDKKSSDDNKKSSDDNKTSSDDNKTSSDDNKLSSLKKTPPIPKFQSKSKEIIERIKTDEQRRSIDKKNRSIKYPWAVIAGMPSGKAKSSPLTKEQQQERKEKLRKIEEAKKKLNNNDDSVEKRLVKPKAKISTKSRGDFLLSNTTEVAKSLKKNGIIDDDDEDEDDDDDNKSKNSNEDSSESDNSDKSIASNKSSDNDKINNDDEKLKNMKKILLKSPRVKLVDCQKFITTKEQKKSSPRQQQQEQQIEKENESPNEIKNDDIVTTNDNKKKPKKRVTFNNKNLTTIRVYEIEEGNNLKKCVAKDAMLPANMMKISKENTLITPKLEEFLLHILNWNPMWLDEQKSRPYPPPIVEPNSIYPLLTKYSSYDDYYKVMEPLLSLEVWAGITREFDTSDSTKRPPFFASIVTGSISIIPTSPNSNTNLTQLMLELVLTKDEATKRGYPDYGDLIIFEMAFNNSKIPCNLFAYVNAIHVNIIAPFTRYNKDLAKNVDKPHTLITYTITTKLLDIKNIAVNRRHRLRKLCYLRSSMRMVQALQYLPASPLLNRILSPSHDNYKLPIINDYENYKLKTNDLLNKKQLEAVVKITEIVVQRKPKICMVQGPPGTGKSKVIVNILTEILYGNDRYKDGVGPLRILVCAPSNAAIDEIVLRLIDIRKNINDKKKFNLVRLGRSETINEAVKSISLEELAKRYVSSKTNNVNQNLESIEAEKSHLLARINKLKMEFEISKKSDNLFQQTLKEKLATTKLKYDLLTNKQTPNNITSSCTRKLHRDAERDILRYADIIACTLSSCYTTKMETFFNDQQKISVCIVDEATQSTEAETLIPLMLGVQTLVLVGDPQQLPATVLSNQAKKYGLDKSLFSRLNGYFESTQDSPVVFLDTQYRMAYPISYWPNIYFYNGALKNASLQILLPFENYRVLNLESIQNTDKYTNLDEATYVTNLIYTMMTCEKLNKVDGTLKIGIVTPYNNQKYVISTKLRDKMRHVPDEIKNKLKWEVNTVDSFQGQERDIIIMSCVRSSGIGFLSDKQRLCVALTRAKHALYLCGNFHTFERDYMWSTLLTDARSRGVYVDTSYKASVDEIRKHIIKN